MLLSRLGRSRVAMATLARAQPLRPLAIRLCSTGGVPKKGADAADEEKAAQPVESAQEAETTAVAHAQETGHRSGGIVLQDHEGENLPPLEFEPGVAGAAQKGVSAVVIAFGAAAFAGIAWGAYMALFPGASSTQTIYSEAFEKVQQDPIVSYALGSPMKAYGMDRGSHRGRRNEMERWELTEANGDEVSVVRFTVAGPQGMGIVQTQVPRSRRRGDFKYILFEHRPSRKLVFVLDNRDDANSKDPNTKEASAPPPIAPAPDAPPPAPAAAAA